MASNCWAKFKPSSDWKESIGDNVPEAKMTERQAGKGEGETKVEVGSDWKESIGDNVPEAKITERQAGNGEGETKV